MISSVCKLLSMPFDETLSGFFHLVKLYFNLTPFCHCVIRHVPDQSHVVYLPKNVNIDLILI